MHIISDTLLIYEKTNKLLSIVNWLYANNKISSLFFIFSEKRREFERRRKLHYNEFEAVMRARQLMEQDEDEDVVVEDIEVDDAPPPQTTK